MASELIVNSFLHAFADRPRGHMMLRLDHVNKGAARLTVTGDGHGRCGGALHRPARCNVINDLEDLLQSEMMYHARPGRGVTVQIDIPLQP